MKTKPAYLIRNGEMVDAINISNKLHSYQATRKALKAARRMGFKNAYAMKMIVNADCKLK